MQRKLRNLRHSRPLVKVLRRYIGRHGIAALGKDRIHQPGKYIAVVCDYRQHIAADIIRKLLPGRRRVQRKERGQKLCDLRSFFRGYCAVRLGSFGGIIRLRRLARDVGLWMMTISPVLSTYTETS